MQPLSQERMLQFNLKIQNKIQILTLGSKPYSFEGKTETALTKLHGCESWGTHAPAHRLWDEQTHWSPTGCRGQGSHPPPALKVSKM